MSKRDPVLESHFAALGGGTPPWEGILIAVFVIGGAILLAWLGGK